MKIKAIADQRVGKPNSSIINELVYFWAFFRLL